MKRNKQLLVVIIIYHCVENVIIVPLKTNLKGYLASLNKQNKKNKEEFSIELEGGLIKGKGYVVMNKIPFKAMDIFFNQPRDFSGSLDIKLNYDLDSN